MGADAPTAWTGDGHRRRRRAVHGRACVAASPEEALSRLEPGDVLVTTITTPAYEAIMPIAGAVVTEQGGLMGHTALVAREHGMAAVVGVVGATTAIPDGAADRGRPGRGPGAGDGRPAGLIARGAPTVGVRAPGALHAVRIRGWRRLVPPGR